MLLRSRDLDVRRDARHAPARRKGQRVHVTATTSRTRSHFLSGARVLCTDLIHQTEERFLIFDLLDNPTKHRARRILHHRKVFGEGDHFIRGLWNTLSGFHSRVSSELLPGDPGLTSRRCVFDAVDSFRRNAGTSQSKVLRYTLNQKSFLKNISFPVYPRFLRRSLTATARELKQ